MLYGSLPLRRVNTARCSLALDAEVETSSFCVVHVDVIHVIPCKEPINNRLDPPVLDVFLRTKTSAAPIGVEGQCMGTQIGREASILVVSCARLFMNENRSRKRK